MNLSVLPKKRERSLAGRKVKINGRVPAFKGATGVVKQKLRVKYSDCNADYHLYELEHDLYLIALDNPVYFRNGAIEYLVVFPRCAMEFI